MEIKEIVENMAKDFKDFQATNDENLKSRDALNEEKLAKLTDSITEAMQIKQDVEQLKAAQNAESKEGGVVNSMEEFEAKHSEAFLSFMRKGDEGLYNELKENKSLAVNIEADGGVTVSPAVSSQVTKQIFETSPMRSLASVETISTDSLEILVDDNTGISGGWVAEKASRPETNTPELGKIKIPVHEQYANPAATQKILDDGAFNPESWLAEKTADIIGRTENTAFVTGNGVGKPRGFTTLDAWTSAGVYQRDAIEQIASGSSGAVTADGLKNMDNALKAEYLARATWVMQRETFGDILKLKDGENRYLLGDGSLNNSDQMRLLGKTVVFASDMPAIAADALAVALGDFNTGYTIVDRKGLTVLRDPYTNKPFVHFYTTKRVGGDVTNFEAIKIQKLEA